MCGCGEAITITIISALGTACAGAATACAKCYKENKRQKEKEKNLQGPPEQDMAITVTDSGNVAITPGARDRDMQIAIKRIKDDLSIPSHSKHHRKSKTIEITSTPKGGIKKLGEKAYSAHMITLNISDENDDEIYPNINQSPIIRIDDILDIDDFGVALDTAEKNSANKKAIILSKLQISPILQPAPKKFTPTISKLNLKNPDGSRIFDYKQKPIDKNIDDNIGSQISISPDTLRPELTRSINHAIRDLPDFDDEDDGDQGDENGFLDFDSLPISVDRTQSISERKEVEIFARQIELKALNKNKLTHNSSMNSSGKNLEEIDEEEEDRKSSEIADHGRREHQDLDARDFHQSLNQQDVLAVTGKEISTQEIIEAYAS